MRMDFEQAEKYYQEVYSLTKNELELLIADIGLMKIYQRTEQVADAGSTYADKHFHKVGTGQ